MWSSMQECSGSGPRRDCLWVPYWGSPTILLTWPLMGIFLHPAPTSRAAGWLKDRKPAPTCPPSPPEALASTASPSCSSSRTSQSTSPRTPVPHPGKPHRLSPASSLLSGKVALPPPGMVLRSSSSTCWGHCRGFPGLPAVLPLRRCPSPHSYQLAQRTFRTFDFYKKHQEAMTPAGLAFFQCRWDDSVTHTFHQLLGKGLVVRQA